AEYLLGDLADVEFVAHPARHLVQRRGVKLLSDELLQVLPQAPAEAVFNLVRDFHTLHGVPRIDVSLGWFEDRLLIPSPQACTRSHEAKQRVFHGASGCTGGARADAVLSSVT